MNGLHELRNQRPVAGQAHSSRMCRWMRLLRARLGDMEVVLYTAARATNGSTPTLSDSLVVVMHASWATLNPSGVLRWRLRPWGSVFGPGANSDAQSDSILRDCIVSHVLSSIQLYRSSNKSITGMNSVLYVEGVRTLTTETYI